MNNFQNRIEQFHSAFGLPAPAAPTEVDPARLLRFIEILADELDEGKDVYVAGAPLVTLTNLSDWLCDIMIYCASEARRHGIPLAEVSEIIFDSNDSKLGEDGKAIIRDGKVQKGPNYWKPEPKIYSLLATRMGVGE